MPKFIVKSMRDGFRRGGIEWSREGVTIDTDELTESQLQAINDEPLLVVYAAIDDDGNSAPVEKSEDGRKPQLKKTAKKTSAK